MSLFEFLFERRNPGNVGSIEKNDKPINKVSIPVLIFKIIVSVAIVYGLLYLFVLHNLSFMSVFIFAAVLILYCLISYSFIPKPDTSNIGWLGGLIDHPFRYSDDLNRMLVFFYIILLPGRFIATTVLQTIHIFIKR